MSKTITIPTYNNPFTININNKEYTYRGGDTIEVPDEVAEAIEDALELEPKPKRYLNKLAQLAEGSITELTASDLEGITAIDQFAFYYCDNLQRVVIPSSVNSIGYSAFRYSGDLKRVEFPESVLNIDDKAFDNCISLTRVVLKALTPPIIQLETFANIPPSCVFEVPLGSLEAYKSANHWRELASRIVAIEE